MLLEYGLFAGHLGRHRCILLMPDHPRFRIPSDFLGVAGFELYTDQTLNAVAQKVPERLGAAFTADGFKPPSLQERCRRLLLLSGWIRSEIAKSRLDLSKRSLKEQFGEKIKAILCFLKEDIDTLGLRKDADSLEGLVRKSLDKFPYVPDRRETEYKFKRDVQCFLSNPREYGLAHPMSRARKNIFNYDRQYGCPWCNPIGFAWFIGAEDMLAFVREKLGEFDHTISSLDRWQQDWVPDILDLLSVIEQTVHKQLFGHL